MWASHSEHFCWQSIMNRRAWIKQNGLASAGLLFSPHVILGGNTTGLDLIINPLWDQKGIPIKHTWAGLGNIDQARWVVRSDMQEQLSMWQKWIRS